MWNPPQTPAALAEPRGTVWNPPQTRSPRRTSWNPGTTLMEPSRTWWNPRRTLSPNNLANLVKPTLVNQTTPQCSQNLVELWCGQVPGKILKHQTNLLDGNALSQPTCVRILPTGTAAGSACCGHHHCATHPSASLFRTAAFILGCPTQARLGHLVICPVCLALFLTTEFPSKASQSKSSAMARWD